MERIHPRKPLAERFWAKVIRGAPEDCWPWTAHRNKKGYGEIGRGGKFGGTILAHRASFELHHGVTLEAYQVVCHRCDNSGCVNPNHLWLGDVLKNNADMVSKIRHSRGIGHGMAKLSEDDVISIRRLIACGNTNESIAALYGISSTHVSGIKTGRFWKHLL